jgi:hypothetical protein
VKELSSYGFSPLREGDLALHRGSGSDLAPILLIAAEETSPGCVERLEHEYALKAELDADWAARPVALTHYNDRMTLVLEDPGGAPVESTELHRQFTFFVVTSACAEPPSKATRRAMRCKGRRRGAASNFGLPPNEREQRLDRRCGRTPRIRPSRLSPG